MPGAGRGHGPQEKGKARDGWKPQRGRSPQLEHAGRRSSCKSPKKRSRAQSPDHEHTPQDKSISTTVEDVKKAAHFVIRNANLPAVYHWIHQHRKREEESKEGGRREERRQRRTRSVLAGANRSHAGHAEYEGSRSQCVDRGHGRHAARGDENTSAPRAGSGRPEFRDSRGHGRTRRDYSANSRDLKASEPKGIPRKLSPVICQSAEGRTRRWPRQNEKASPPPPLPLNAVSDCSVRSSQYEESRSPDPPSGSRPRSRSRSRSRSGSVSKASGVHSNPPPRRQRTRSPSQATKRAKQETPNAPATSRRVILSGNVANEEKGVTRAVAGDARVPPPPSPRRQHEGPAHKTSSRTDTKLTRRNDRRDEANREERTGNKKFYPARRGWWDPREHKN